MEIDLKMLVDIFNGLGTLGVLTLILVLFYRGDILPRKVYEELTRNLLTQLVDEIKDALKEINGGK